MASKDKKQERVYALHDFDAENPDEVSFKAGEVILVVEKDDAYGDGWWQGSNERGETGLFPFSYTTYDRSAAIGIVNSAVGAAAGPESVDDATREANGKGVKATMDDIDIALARMQAGSAGVGDDASERTGDMSVGETDENEDVENDYEKRAKARAALAVNAAKNNEDAGEAERAEQARRKAQAMRVFQEEEEKHRQLLLKKEEQRKEAAAQGNLPSEKPKAAPIAGVDMSDESDSEGSVGPDIDDVAPTHAPLFGPTSIPAAASVSGPKPQTLRPLSPIASDDAHARSKDLNAKNGNGAPHQRNDEPEGRSIESSRISGSPAPGKSFGTAPSIGTAPTSQFGTDTPRSSQITAAQMSPAPSATGSRGLGPGGDPHEWTVEQVVEWGRSKGWDEASIVSKFAEHEISGDVLMEMDANILKEIEITAFGKRFQVANAIKDLKRSVTQDSSQGQWSTPVAESTPNTVQQQQARSVSQPISERPSSNVDNTPLIGTFNGLGAPINGQLLNQSQRTVSQHSANQDPAPSPFRAIQPELPENSGDTYPSTFGSGSGDMLSQQDGYRPTSIGSFQGKSSFSPDNSISYSNFNQQHATSPRRRESAGSSTKSPTERTSFFAGLGGQRNRKPAPRVQGGAQAVANDSDSLNASSNNNKGTLSRLGFNRHKGSQGADGPQDLRNKISLPTGSPTFDAMGDTARRHRLSHMGPAGVPISGFSGHQRQTSVGSGGPGAAEWHTPNEPRSPGNMAPEGAVMVRIRPVDYEGWMRKKGERYNSWKPRYMALKGSDLVLLRDPTAPKIKGYVNMKGYKVIADETTNPGKYGFKILHESEKPHYFSSDDALAVRDWMKALMKATIGRDTTLPVISSYNNATISLKEAQRMNPPPRPPSPTSRARAQRAAARANKDQLTAKDASVLMGMQSPQNRAMGLILPASPDEQCNVDATDSSKAFDDIKLESKLARRRSESLKRLAPLQLVKRSKPSYLPYLDRDESAADLHEVDREHEGVLISPAAPTPPTKSGQVDTSVEDDAARRPDNNFAASSPTEGLADLPAPPPPTHSADHADRIRAFLTQQRQRNASVTSLKAAQEAKVGATSVPSPTTPTQASVSSLAPPLPLSKSSAPRSRTPTASSVAAYPTVSSLKTTDEQETMSMPNPDSAPVAGKHASRFSRMMNKPRQLRRPKTMASEAEVDRDAFSQRSSLYMEELAADEPIKTPKSADSTRMFDKIRRPRTASEAPSFPRRSRAMTLHSPPREGSFIVFSVRKQGGGVQGHHDEKKESGEGIEDGKKLTPVLDQPLQSSPSPMTDNSLSPASVGRAGRMRMKSAGAVTARKGQDAGKGERRLFVETSFPKALSSGQAFRDSRSFDVDALTNEPSEGGISMSSQLIKAGKRTRRTPSIDNSEMSMGSPYVATSEILQSKGHANSSLPWSGSPYFQASASNSTFSVPQRSSPLVRGSVNNVDELGKFSPDVRHFSPLHLSEAHSSGDGSAGSARGWGGSEDDMQNQGNRPKTMKFRSWLNWRGNRNKQRESELEIENSLALAEAELRSERSRREGDSPYSSNDGGRHSSRSTGLPQSNNSPRQHGMSQVDSPYQLGVRGNASEQFERPLHQHNQRLASESEVGQRSLSRSAGPGINPSFLNVHQMSRSRQASEAASSEFMEEVATSASLTGGEIEAQTAAPPPPIHSPPLMSGQHKSPLPPMPIKAAPTPQNQQPYQHSQTPPPWAGTASSSLFKRVPAQVTLEQASNLGSDRFDFSASSAGHDWKGNGPQTQPPPLLMQGSNQWHSRSPHAQQVSANAMPVSSSPASRVFVATPRSKA